jgi:hypothetical protein
VHPMLLEELAAARIDELRRQVARGRRDRPLRPSPLARAMRRSLQSFGFLLVGAGLRLATVGERQGPTGRSLM